MNDSLASQLSEVTACKHLVDDYVKRHDEACAEYYSTGKKEFTNLTRAEDEDLYQNCELVLARLVSAMPDAMNRWHSIKYPSDQYDAMVERMRDVWLRRRNLLRTIENFLKTTLELARSESPEAPRQAAILFLAADPSDATRLRLGEEFREINENLRRAQNRASFKLTLPQTVTAAI